MDDTHQHMANSLEHKRPNSKRFVRKTESQPPQCVKDVSLVQSDHEKGARTCEKSLMMDGQNDVVVENVAATWM